MENNSNKNNTTTGSCFDLSLDELLSTLVKRFTKRAKVRKVRKVAKILSSSNLYDLALMDNLTDAARERLLTEFTRMSNRQGGAL